jgi:capsular exopolysaccharide synthesis family protein
VKKENKMELTQQSDVLQIDFTKYFFKLLSYWWLFALSLIIAIGAGYFYLRYANYKYSAEAILLIKDTGRSGQLSEASILLDGGFTGGGKSLVNEIEVLRSTPLMKKVVEELNLNTAIFKQGRVRESELYINPPLTITRLDSVQRWASFYIEPDGEKSFYLKTDPEEEGTRYYYNVPFRSNYGYLNVERTAPNTPILSTLRISLQPIYATAENYAGKLFIERIGDIRLSSVLKLQMNDPIARRAEDVLSSLIENYNEAEIDDENTVLRNTIEFIDKRVALLTQELNIIEGDLERFKSNNSIITETAASSLNFTLSEIRSAIQEINQYEVRISILEALEELLQQKTGTYDLVPANLSTESSILATLLQEYNSLILERRRLSKSVGAASPILSDMEERLETNKDLLMATIQTTKKDVNILIDQLERNMDGLEKEMGSIPTIERSLIERSRMQKVKEELFLFLLQKREETALSEAVATANTRVIEPARSSGSPVSPRKQLVYLGCTLLGLFAPLSIIGAVSLFDNRVRSEDTIKSLTSIPIIGRIIQGKKKDGSVVVKYGDRSPINEMFRQLRTNLSYLSLNQSQKTIAVTSFVSGEGKSFISINLAITLALSDKKVVLVGMDLRKPKLTQYLGVDDQGKGVTTHLIGEASLAEVTQKHPDYENLDVIASGPIPPNPYELIVSKQMTDFLERLKANYDYVLVDTPPIGLVSDALLLRDQIDNLLIVVRHQYTRKFMLREVQKMYESDELPKANIILNGIKYNRASYGYGYGYGGYREAYGKGYYN